MQPRHSTYTAQRQPLELFAGDPVTPLIRGIVAPPGLHLLLGANRLIQRIEQLYPGVQMWWRRYNFIRPPYHAGDFEATRYAT